MSHLRLPRTVLVGGALVASLALGSCEATQPKPYCRARQDTYAARYTTEGTPQGNCTGKILTGEILHLQYYRSEPTAAQVETSIAIEPDSVAELVKGATVAMGSREYSIGKYTSVNPGDDGLCRVPSLTDTNVTVGTTTLSYTWSNVQMIVTADSNGIHFGADLVRKDGDCTVMYKVSAINPVLHCGDGVDAMGHPDPTFGKPDPEACEPVQGSGLSPDLQYECDATPDGARGTHMCVPARSFPAFK